MKNFKRVLSVLLVCAMIVPMCIFTVSAETPELTNWYTMAGKYSASTNDIIAPKKDGYAIKTDGFTFDENEDGGISVHTATYGEFNGAYGASAITSKTTTPLDGLTVVVEPEQFDFTIDNNETSNSIGIIWSEDPITALASFDETANRYTSGLSDAVKAGTNGLRHLIPVSADDTTKGIPVANAIEQGLATNGKALYISVSNAYGEYDGSKTASTVNIVYYDGHYINANDGHPGYRWTFTARNSYDQDQNGDLSGVVARFCEIDLTYGLVVKVRADETCGYIVNINGVDYYKGRRAEGDSVGTPIIGYYPDALVDGTSHKALTDEDYALKSETYLKSMTYARENINLTGLTTAGEGYLTIGTVSIKDQYITGHACDYTVANINTVPAAEWKGESFPAGHVCEYTDETIDATCTEDGAVVHRCACGSVYSDRIAALGHDMILDEDASYDPTCTDKGREVKNCSRCNHHTDVWVTALGHELDDWYVSEVATPDTLGTKKKDCTRCDYFETKSYTYSGLDDVIDDWEITATNGISVLDTEMPVVDAELNDDGSVLVKDYSLMTGLNASHNTVTKAINKHKTSLNGFSATVTPVALNENFPDQYAESLSFTLTNVYDKYNCATEYSTGWLSKQLPEHYHGILSNEVYRYGNVWGYPYSTDTLKEYTVSFTLMDYMPLQGTPKGTDNDGYYDIVFWSVRAQGNHWTDGYVQLDLPIKMGDPVDFNLFYEKDSTTGNKSLIAAFNPDWENWGNIFDMSGVSSSQSSDAIYSFVVAAHSPTIPNPENSMESISASSFVINSVCGESAVDFDGYYVSSDIDDMTGEYIPLETPHTHEDVTNNKWVVVENATCVENGLEAKYCTLCGEIVETQEIVADGQHTPDAEWTTLTESDYFNCGVAVLYCEVCGEVVETKDLPVKPYENPFPDVKPSQWYGVAVEYVVKRGYMSGNANGTFAPNGTLTREQFVIILANMAGADTDAYKGANGGFTDIKANQWYTGAVVWAVNEGYVTGLGNGKFGRGEPIQRAALARLLYLYAEKNNIETAEPTTDFSAFADAKKIDNWMKDGIGWAVANGIVSGNKKADGKLYIEPKGTATRAQAAVMLRAFDVIRGLVTID